MNSNIETHFDHSIIILIDKRIDYRMDRIYDESQIIESINEKESVKVSQGQRLGNYECYIHDLSSYSEIGGNSTLNFEGYGPFVSLRLFICNIGIETFRGEKKNYLIFKPKHVLIVYFYNRDDVPLMVKYEGLYYRPKSKDYYFNKWVEVGLVQQVIDENSDIEHNLDIVNKELNEIILNKRKKYGIPIDMYPDLILCFDSTRVNVKFESYNQNFSIHRHTTQNFSQFNKTIFIKTLHKTHNQNIFAQGKSVGVYYFNKDLDGKYPLILEYITLANNYRYYLLKGDDPCFYELKDQRNKIDKRESARLLDHQIFIYHKVINIKLEKQIAYTCCDDDESKFIIRKENDNESPPYKYCYINTKGDNQKKFPIINLETGFINPILNSNKFKRYSHRMGQFEIYQKKTTTFGTHEQNILMTIKGFMIKKKEILLKDISEQIKRLEISTSVIYVYFYDKDPRPLLMCVENKTYYPESMAKYFIEWDIFDHFQRCHSPNYTILLDKLKEIYYYLNPVDTSKKGDYEIHEKFPEIKIQVDNSTLKCFKYYTHAPQEGLKLGEITYNRTGKIYKLFDSYDEYQEKYKDKEIMTVIVYYYNFDINNEYPLIIQLNYKGDVGSYYGLDSTAPGYKWEKLDKFSNLQDELLLKLQKIYSDFDINDCGSSEDFECNISEDQEINNFNHTREEDRPSGVKGKRGEKGIRDEYVNIYGQSECGNIELEESKVDSIKQQQQVAVVNAKEQYRGTELQDRLQGTFVHTQGAKGESSQAGNNEESSKPNDSDTRSSGVTNARQPRAVPPKPGPTLVTNKIPAGDTETGDVCKWVSSGVAGLGVVSCASYLAYKYREMIPVRDMRAIF